LVGLYFLANLSRAAKRWFVFEPMSTDNAIQPPILSEEERKLFAEHQRFITKARACGTEAGKRLAEIRDRKLYRERFRTFEGFCRTRWNLSKRCVEKLIAEAEVVTQPSR
jgi:hypothetical protein